MTDLQKAFGHIDQFAGQLLEHANIPGLAIAVTDREKTLQVSTFGVADLAAKTPVTPETVFEIGSLAKTFTSIPLLQLRDEGKLDLNQPVADYLPGGAVEPLDSLGEGLFRVGANRCSPETLRFQAVVEGQAIRADYSGCPYYRAFTR